MSQPSNPNAGLDVNKIVDPILRRKCTQLLRTVPVYTARECCIALCDTNGNVEKAALSLSDPTRMAARSDNQIASALAGNVMVEPQIKIDTMRLRRSFPHASTQNCYLALRIAMGDYEDAARQLERDNGTVKEQKPS